MSTTEVGVTFSVIIYRSKVRLNVVRSTIYTIGQQLVNWAYLEVKIVISFTRRQDAATISSNLPIWSMINRNVMARGPVRPARIIRNALQALYIRTKGGVDAAAQFRSKLRSTGLNVGWERKIVLYCMKSLLVNGFIV